MRADIQHYRWPAAILVFLLIAVTIIWRQQATPFDRIQSERLIAAIQTDDIAGVTQTLTQNADPNYSPMVSRSAVDSFRIQLHLLCFWDRNLYRGAQRAIMAHEDTPLALAVRQEKVEMVNLLLAHHAKPDAPIQNGITPLMLAANQARHETNTPQIIATLLLEKGANPNAHSLSAPGSTANTPLRMAAFSSFPRPMVFLLLKNGAVPEDEETRAQLKRLHIALKPDRNSP